MRKFEFKKRVPLDIAGHLFSVTVDEDTAHKLTAFGTQAQELGKDPDATRGDAWAFMEASIEGLLGAGAVATIFDGRPRILEDAVEVMDYIVEEIRAAVE